MESPHTRAPVRRSPFGKWPLRLGALFVLWACGVASGFWVLTEYEVRPAGLAAAPAEWPTASRIQRSAKGGTLLMFVHPHCPCSQASLVELAAILEQHEESVGVHLLFVRPDGVDANWTNTRLRRIAAQIPGAMAHDDARGDEAVLFAANTSGEVLFYDACGRLAFHGGVTAARGHYGASTSSELLSSLLEAKSIKRGECTAVYGCPLGTYSKSCCESRQ